MSDTGFLFHPVTHEAAREFIQSKPVVARNVFNQMLPEIRGRAFTITGVSDANVMQHVLDAIAELPEGAVWDDVKRGIADELSQTDPFVPNPGADAKEIEASRAAAEARAELLMRTHGFQAYESANHQAIAANADVFPYSMYVTAGDERVRDTHAALNGVCLPTDHPFWLTHTPPWEWGCRCTKVGKTAEEVGVIRDEDASRLPEQRQIIEGAALAKLEENGVLFRSVGGAPAQNFDVRPPVEKATTDAERRAAYQWNPDTLRMPLDQLKARYSDATGKPNAAWDVFEAAMKSANVEGLADDGGISTVWEWLKGEAQTVLTPLPPLTPRESPVSAAIRVEGHGPFRRKMEYALRMADQAHDDGKLPPLPLSDRLEDPRPQTLAQYRSPLKTGWKSGAGLGVRRRGQTPELSALHEVGHALDELALVDGMPALGVYASEVSDLFNEFRASASESGSFKMLKLIVNASVDAAEQKTLANRLTFHEVFGRAYAQWVAERTGDARLLKQLAIKDRIFYYWSQEDFKPIREALDRVFATKGWL